MGLHYNENKINEHVSMFNQCLINYLYYNVLKCSALKCSLKLCAFTKIIFKDKI